MPKRASTIVIAACGAAILLVSATGCGGDSSSDAATTTAASATHAEQWSTDVCTAITTWKQNVSQAAKSIKANPSKDQVTLALEHARQWTQALAEHLRALGPPKTESGTQARKTLETLGGQLREGSAEIKTAIGETSGVKGSVQTVSTVSSTLVAMRDQVKAAGERLRALPQGELEQAISTSTACKHLTSTAA